MIRGFLGKLEKVSEDPSLAEEMDKEVDLANATYEIPLSCHTGWKHK